jgi:hypothetical protein
MSWKFRSTPEPWKSRSTPIRLTSTTTPYKTHDHHWMPISHTHADMEKKTSVCMRNFKKLHLDRGLVDLVKIRRWWVEESWTWWKSDDFDQNMENRPRFGPDFACICWHERKFFVSMKNSKKLHLNRRLVDLMKIRRWWIEESRTWWKSGLKSMLRNHLINVTRTHINEMLNNDDRRGYICI